MVVYMKNKITFLLNILITFCCHSYGKEFQVVVLQGEVYRIANGTKVNLLEIIGDDETLNLSNNGYIVLIDNYVNIFEFSGDLSVKLDTLYGDRIRSKNVDVRMLYNDKFLIGSRLHDETPDPILIRPFLFADKIYIKNTVNLKWISRMEGTFRVKVVNFFNDKIIEIKSSSGEVVMDFSQLSPFENELLLKVELIGHEKTINSGFKQMIINDKLVSNCVTSENSPAVNLLTALYIENFGQAEDALKYYQRAAELAPEITEYEKILSLFKKRSSY